ncbi:zinc finger protein 423-like isoform X2 [Physella acuta]|nr:zinc finger protein 423-like isoform X2 [Physella acuta]
MLRDTYSQEGTAQDKIDVLARVASGQDEQVDHNSNKPADVADTPPPEQDVSSADCVDVKPDADLVSKAQVMKCEACHAQFHSLDQFMDHRNLDCCLDTDTKSNWLLSETNSTRSASPSSQSTSSVDAGGGGATDLDCPELDGLDPKSVPFVIGVTDENPHNCQFCEKAFSKKVFLKLHQQTHTAHMPYKCRHCPRLFRHKKSRERHEKLHSSDRKYKCQTCGVGYSRSDHLRNHIKSHDLMENDEGYKCPVCQQNYMSASALTNHLKTHKHKYPSPEVSEPHVCSECSQTFSKNEDLQDHLLTHTTPVSIKMEKFICDICQEIFFTQGHLNGHHEQCHSLELDMKCPVCFLSFSDMNQVCQHLMTHSSTGGQAEGEDTSDSGIMRGLLMDKSPNNNDSSAVTEPNRPMTLPTVSSTTSPGVSTGVVDVLVCPYCLTDGFETLESLELHMTSVHSVKPTEVYTCNYCNAPYPNLYSLHDHMTVVHRSQHGLDITYPCSMCVQRFHSLDALAKHKGIVHAQQRSTGIDAAFCNRCNMTLASPSSLEDHMANVHNIIMDKGHKLVRSKNKKSGLKANKEKDQKSSGLINTSKAGQNSQMTTDTILSSSLLMSSMLNQEGQITPKSSKTQLVRKPVQESLYTNQRLLSASLTCDQCNATFHDAQNFIAHMKLHSESLLNMALGRASNSEKKYRDTGDSEIRGNNLSNQNLPGPAKQHDCFKCGASFSSEEHLEAHASLHYLCVSTEYGCSSCAKNFSKPDELQKHLMDIHAHHLYRCSLCKDIFDSKVNIQVHFAIKHSNECKQYKCVSCDIMFRSEMEWQVHVRVNHLHMSRPYRCLFCQESFTSEVELQCHLTTHSKQFNCPMCDQAFHIEYLLDQHMQTRHGDTKPELGEKSSTNSLKSPLQSSSSSPFKSLTIKQEKEETTNPFANPILSSLSSSTASSSSSCSPRIILKSPVAPSPMKQPRLTSPLTPSISPAPVVSSLGTPSSTIWKNTEPLHMCNICDIKFCDLALLNLHKAQDHGLKAALKSGLPDLSLKTEHDKLLLNNQTLLSALTSPASPVTLAQSPLHQPQLSCMFCSQTFKTSIEYNKHMKIHVNSGNLTCSICDETFTSASVLAEHKLTHCKIQQGNTCVVCRVTLNNQEQFYLHAQEHGFEGSLLQCVVCRQTLSSLVELQMHGRHHFQTRPAFFTCCVCLKSFESKENLVSKLNSSGRTYYVCKPCYHGEAPLHTCSQCSEKFATAQLLETHMQTHKATFQCIKCQQSFSSEYEIQLHVTSHMLNEGTQHECRLCGVVCDSPARLQTHLIQHSFAGKEIVCFVCNKVFESPQEIQVHALEHGASFRKYGCPQCSQKFFFTAELDNHKLIYSHGMVSPSINTPSLSPSSSALFSSSAALSMATLASFLSTSPLMKPQDVTSSPLALANKKLYENFSLPSLTSGYELPSCSGSAVKGQETLTVPSVPSSSTTANGLQCPECLKYFSTGTALANHRKTHWKKDATSSIRCSLCSQVFDSATSMQQHFFTVHSTREEEQRKKKSFKCMMCEKECSTLSALQNHILSHRTGSSLPCPVCKKTFTSQRYLNLHMRVHKLTDNKTQEPSTSAQSPVDSEDQTDTKENSSSDLLCPICSQSFISTQEIDNHIKTHEEVFTTLGNAHEAMDFSEPGVDESDRTLMEVEDR